MLNWLAAKLKKTGESDHPLGSADGIDRYLSEIPTVDPQRVLLEIGRALEEPDHLAEEMGVEPFARAAERLDAFARPAALACWSALLADAAARHQGILAAPALQGYLAGSHAANRVAMEFLAREGGDSRRRALVLAAVRAMRTWVDFGRLARMAYRAPEAAWWTAFFNLQRRARDLGIVYEAADAYTSDPLPTSVWKEYQTALLFETAPLSSLTAGEIDMVGRLARWLEPHCRYADAPSALTPFYIRPAGDSGPSRRPEGTPAEPDARFFGPGLAHGQLVQLSAGIVRDGKLPDWLADTGLSAGQVVRLLQTLIAHWSASPPMRQQPRRAGAGAIRVVNGLDLVRRMIAASEFARSGRTLDYEGYLKTQRSRHHDMAVPPEPPPPPRTPMETLLLLETAGDRQMMEQWEVIDTSAGGLGVRFPARRPWQSIGALVGYRREDELEWHLGIVRRLGSSHGKPNAGLTVFEGTPLCSQVRLSDSAADHAWSQQTAETSGLGWHNAILVSESARQVLIPAGSFSEERPIHISVGGRWRSARLVKLSGRGNDYELAVYRDDPQG